MCPHHLLPARGTATVVLFTGPLHHRSRHPRAVGRRFRASTHFARDDYLERHRGSHRAPGRARRRVQALAFARLSRGPRRAQRAASVETISLAGHLRPSGPRSRSGARRLGRAKSMSAVVVTGASRGIGRAIAIAFAERGFDVALLARTESDLEEVARRGHRARHPGARDCHAMSRRRTASVRRATEPCRCSERPRCSSTTRASFAAPKSATCRFDDFRAVVDTNLTGTFSMTRALLARHAPAPRGRFIQVASISSTLGSPPAPRLIAPPNGGWSGFTKSLAEELRGTGLATMSVLPGSVDTAMLEGSGYCSADDRRRGGRTGRLRGARCRLSAMNGSSIEISAR